MNKASKIGIVIAALVLSGIVVGIGFQNQQSNTNHLTTPQTPSSSSSSASESTGSTQTVDSPTNQMFPIAMGSPVKIDNGNITATAIDPNSQRVYVVYYKTQNNVTNLYLSRSDDNGKTFSSAVRVNDIAGDVSADGYSPPVIKVASTGDVYVSWLYTDYNAKWMGRFAYGYGTIRVARSSDGGETFTKAAHVDTEEYGKWVYVSWVNSNGAGNKPNFTDIIMIAKSTDGAQTFGKATQVDSDNPACSCCKVNLAVDKDGSVFVSWRKLFQAPESEHTPPTDVDHAYRQIVVAKSMDGAQTFSAPVKVYDDKFLFNGCVMSGSQMAIDSKNNLHIVWYTGSNTTGFTPGSYYSVSSDDGKTFAKPIPLVAGKDVGATLEYMAIDGKDNTWITWEDRTGQTNEMWMYNELPPTKIAVAKITPDGQMSKTVLDIGAGKLPSILVTGKTVGIVWNTKDHTVKFASVAQA